MASIEQIVSTAKDLGKLIASHDACAKFQTILRKLEKDVEAQRTLTDYNRHLQTIAEKEQNGQPIEVEDKRKLEKFQNGLIDNSLLREFQVAQMDFLDLMRRVDETIAAESGTISTATSTSGQSTP